MNQKKLLKTLAKFEIFFRWLYWFYPRGKGIHFAYLLYFFIPQKVLRINGRVPWPVHFTSRIQHPGKIEVGYRAAPGMNSGCYIQGRNGIKIGHNVRFGTNIGLISANHTLDNYDIWTEDAPIEIGNNVWLGMNVVVLPGVTIGDNVVIGANSVVSKDIPANSIAVGSPCRVVKEKPPYVGFDYSQL